MDIIGTKLAVRKESIYKRKYVVCVYTNVYTVLQLFNIPARLMSYYEHLTGGSGYRLLCECIVFVMRARERDYLYIIYLLPVCKTIW